MNWQKYIGVSAWSAFAVSAVWRGEPPGEPFWATATFFVLTGTFIGGYMPHASVRKEIGEAAVKDHERRRAVEREDRDGA
jgi:hypothetical protein